MIKLTYKQEKLIKFINDFRRYKELEITSEFRTKEELDNYIRSNYNEAKRNRAMHKSMMGYHENKRNNGYYTYKNTSYGNVGKDILIGKKKHTGECIVIVKE